MCVQNITLICGDRSNVWILWVFVMVINFSLTLGNKSSIFRGGFRFAELLTKIISGMTVAYAATVDVLSFEHHSTVVYVSTHRVCANRQK